MEKETIPHKTKSTEDKLIAEGLEAIYGKDQVDFSKMDKGRSRFTSILLTIVITLAVIAITSWTAFFIYTKYFAPVEEETFTLEIEVSEELVSGEMANIKINYNNHAAVPLASLELQLRLPKAFEIQNLAPEPDNSNDLIWDIGSVGANSDGSITINGIWIADVPSSTPIQVFANYKPANFNANFSEIETVYINTTISTIQTTIKGPEETQPGEELEYTITIKNNGDEIFKNIVVDLGMPTGFFLEESIPEIEAGSQPTWTFDKLEKNEEKEITFIGSFAADREGFHYFDATTSILSENQNRFTQNIADAFTDVLRHDLSLQLVANGTTENLAVGLNDVLRIAISLENTGDSNINNANILIDFKSDKAVPIVWGNADLDSGKITSDGIEFNSKIIGSIEPGKKRLLNLSFPIDSNVGSGQTDTFAVIASSTSDNFEIRSTPIQVSITTEAEFTASVRYFDDQGTPLGNGALPPKVGENTSYRAYWTIENSLHDLENIEVSAVLPPHVTWMDSYSTDLGSITYDSGSNTMYWRITHLPSTVTKVEANAYIRINPDNDDVGKFIKLMSGSIFKARDAVTKSIISDATDSLTTELIGDEFAEDKGVVVK